jgi:uncharacterized membrane protein
MRGIRQAGWLLPASLALNVFLIVFVLVGLRPLLFGPGPGPRPPQEMVQKMAEGLPSHDGAILREAFAARAGEFDRADVVLRALPERVRAILRAEPLNVEALTAAFASTSEARTNMDSALGAAMVEASGKMSPEGRRALAEFAPPGPPRR